MSADQASTASGQDRETPPFPAGTTFSSVNLEERDAHTQADAFLEWSKGWDSAKCDAVGKALRHLVSEDARSVLGKEKSDNVRSRVGDMLWALEVAEGRVTLEYDPIGSSSDAGGDMEED